jgi:HAD superfamily hydrolase (TIGR01509 family)
MLLEALIFDVDGTLAETEELHRRSFNEAFRHLGLDWEWDPPLYAELLQTTGGKERIIRYVTEYRPDERAVLDRLPALYKVKTQSYLALLRDGALSLRPGIRRLVMEAKTRGIKLAIATTSNPHNVRALLHSSFGEDAPHLFTVAAGDIAPRKKPSPDVYYQALEALDLGPKRAVAFEDSTNGLQAALSAGLAVIVTPSLFLQKENLQGAFSVISDLGEPEQHFRHLDGYDFPKGFVDIDGLEAALQTRDTGSVWF